MRSKKELEKIEQSLLTRKKELEEELARLHSEKCKDDEVQDPGDQALSAVFESLKSSLQDTELQEHKMIIHALDMLKKGEYGVCNDCGGSISTKRLESYPNAARCLICQETAEENQSKGRVMHFL